MSKFGDLIDAKVPVLLAFYNEGNHESENMNPVLRTIASNLGDAAKVIKIDIEKNQELADALKIKTVPTLMIYKDGEMKWRQSGEQDAGTLTGLLQEYVAE
ncbi:MAG TPA: thioredoxin family protein [Flavobacteriaceae bacterium]|nr:thioredoxin family protein [Flavobacteriaceae bacterium]